MQKRSFCLPQLSPQQVLEIRLAMPPAVETWRGESAMEMVDDSETGIPVKLPNAREVLISYILDSKILPGKGK